MEKISAQVEGDEGARATIARNAFYLLLGQIATTVLGVFFSAALGRGLGAENFGVYFLVFSFAIFVYVVVDWGQSFFIINAVARRPERDGDLLGTSLVLRTIGAVLILVPFWLLLWALRYDATIRLYSVVFIMTGLPFLLAQSYGMVFRARYLMGLDAGVSVANKAALLAFGLPALALGAGIPGIFAAQALAGLLAFALASFFYHRIKLSPLSFSRPTARETLIGGSAFFTFVAASNIQPYIDVVLLSKFSPVEAVGWFGAAKNILGVLTAPAAILSSAYLPRLSQTASNESAFESELLAGLRPMLWLGALAAVGTYLFASDAIDIVYGAQNLNFAHSKIIMQVYAPTFFLLFINYWLGTAVFVKERAKAYSIAKWVSLGVSTALGLVLIPLSQEHYGNGGIGVVAAFGASEIFVFVGAIFLLRSDALISMLSLNTGRALVAATLTLLLFQYLPPLPFLIGAPLCVIAFLLCSLALGLVRLTDLDLLRAALRKKAGVAEEVS